MTIDNNYSHTTKSFMLRVEATLRGREGMLAVGGKRRE
jgi:hypothetical protein